MRKIGTDRLKKIKIKQLEKAVTNLQEGVRILDTLEPYFSKEPDVDSFVIKGEKINTHFVEANFMRIHIGYVKRALGKIAQHLKELKGEE